MSITLQDDKNGKPIVLFKCHAGCDQNRLVDAIKSQGLWAGPSRNGHVPRGKVVAEFAYHDESGRLLYIKERVEPGTGGRNKYFRFKHSAPDASGWHWGLGGEKCSCPRIKRALYNLRDLVSAAPGALVLFVEGEAKADKLKALGYLATTTSVGANRSKEANGFPEDFSALAGHPVTILPDHDEAGNDHAQRLGERLQGVARETRLLELPGLTDKQDIIDWLAMGHSREELVELLAHAPVWRPGPEGHSADIADIAPIDWEIPSPLKRGSQLPFPIDCLPKPIQEFVLEEAEALQVPLDLPGCLVIGAGAAAAAGRCIIRLNPDWFEPLNLYTVIALESGERKSPAFREAMAPLEEREAELSRASVYEIEEAKTEREVLEKRLQATKADAAKAKGIQAEQLIYEAKQLANTLASFEVPNPPRLLADDVTPEAVGGLLAEQSGRLAIASAEGGLFETIAGRYSDGVPNLDVFLKAYTGDVIRIDRRGRAPEFIPNPALSIVLTAQPEVIQGLAEKRGFRARGLLARFLYSIPTSRVGYRSNEEYFLPDDVKKSWKGIIGGLLKIAYPIGMDDHAIRLSGEAAGTLREFRDAIEVMLRPGADLSDIADWSNKLPGAVIRIAGILHLFKSIGAISAQYAESLEPWETPLSEETMREAIALGNYFMSHAQAAFALMGTPSDMTEAEKVWAAISRHGFEQFSQRELFNKVRGSIPTMARLLPILGVLEDLGYIRQLPSQPTGKAGRPPSPVYAVNPLACSQNAQ